MLTFDTNLKPLYETSPINSAQITLFLSWINYLRGNSNSINSHARLMPIYKVRFAVLVSNLRANSF